MSVATLNPEQARLIARILSLHFEEGKPQSEIAKELRLSTAKVNRLIKQGREMGMLQITIKSPLLRLFDLERSLIERWNLKNCVIVPAVSGNAEATLNEVGKGAASLLTSNLRDGDTIAISGGKTLSTLIECLNSDRKFDVNVVPMTGGVQGQHYTDVNHLATELAQKIGGQTTLIHAPLHAESGAERDMLMAMKSVSEVMEKARNAAVALVGVGAVLGAQSTYYQAHPVSESERQRLYESGVRSEFLGHLIDQDGALSANDFNSRLVALLPAETAKIPVSIAIASGAEKVAPLVAAMRGGYFNSLVSDETTARSILEEAPNA